MLYLIFSNQFVPREKVTIFPYTNIIIGGFEEPKYEIKGIIDFIYDNKSNPFEIFSIKLKVPKFHNNTINKLNDYFSIEVSNLILKLNDYTQLLNVDNWINETLKSINWNKIYEDIKL